MVNTGTTTRDGYQIYKPSMVKSYNTHMGGVDRTDQQLHSIQALRKTYKWYKKLAIPLILRSSLSSCKIYEKHTGRKIGFVDFLIDCIKMMVSRAPRIQLPINFVNDADVPRLTGRDYPSLIPLGENDQRPHKRYRVCYVRGKTTENRRPLKTVYICAGSPSLHPDKSFRLYHKKLDFYINRH